MNIEHYITWIKGKNLENGRYPTPNEVKNMGCGYIINVSDEYIHTNLDIINETKIKYFWFPMTECFGSMGLNSIFGALQILYEAEKENSKAYVHCHAGVNRSKVILDCYHYMRTGEHKPIEPISLEDRIKLNIMFNKKPDHIDIRDDMNFLQINCYDKMLPSLGSMEYMLKELPKFFDLDLGCRGGAMDSIKRGMDEFKDFYKK